MINERFFHQFHMRILELDSFVALKTCCIFTMGILKKITSKSNISDLLQNPEGINKYGLAPDVFNFVKKIQ